MSVFSFKNIYMAYLDCRQNKRNKLDAIEFETQAEDRILRLYERLLDRTYHPSSSICFVAEKPKLREIFAANFEDRVIHHLLVRY
ncbi:reverse transcriptase, partial [Candidatus Magnetomorum sp. HK-1]